MKNVAVIISGCRYLDGAEIFETVFTLLELDKHNVNVKIFAPNKNQHHVINHLTQEKMLEERNILVESASIARGKIQPLNQIRAENFDALILPGGGFGAALNLSDIGLKNENATVSKDLQEIIVDFYNLSKPIGALIFGWIGDTIGRKVTVIITTFMMAFSCIIIASLPTYAEIGITAAVIVSIVIVSICRIIQGMTSMGEIIGSELYLTETIKRPQQYMSVALISFFAVLGATFALGVAFISTSYNFNWRYAFWFGALVALVVSLARTTLLETPEFADTKLRMKMICRY